uniref:Putative reverse transcriptase domain-containing protein n=1 Tax=Tanacetum cinerariifolium TaxID=118510 RepID=A0A699GLL8_TANCI|nr:putative reverse transcriptase domain-containing protein [Tanacetum cinerariifolium]
MKADEKKLKDIHIIRDFPKVFPNDLKGLPPIRPVKFLIDLVPEATFIAKAPYRLAPSEMQELISQPHTLLTQNDKKFDWGEQQEKASQTLKDALCSASILTLPDGPDGFVVYYHTSRQGLGCVLMQKSKAIAYASQKLKDGRSGHYYGRMRKKNLENVEKCLIGKLLSMVNSAIVYNDGQTPKSDLLTKPILSPQHIDEFDLNDETSLSEYDEEEQNVLYFNDLFPFNIIHTDDLKSEKDNDDNKIDIIQSSGGMDDPNITMEGYIRLKEEKARKRRKVFKKETAKYGKIWYDEDIHDLRFVETEFLAIAFNDGVSYEKILSCEPTIISFNIEIDFRISFDDSDDENYTVIFDNFSYKIISTNDLKTNSENDNEKVNMPSLPPPEPTVSCFDDLDFFKYFENKFPAIVYNDAQMPKSDLLIKPILSPQHIDEFDLNDETSLSEYDEEEQNALYFNDLSPLNIIHTDDLKSEKEMMIMRSIKYRLRRVT